MCMYVFVSVSRKSVLSCDEDGKRGNNINQKYSVLPLTGLQARRECMRGCVPLKPFDSPTPPVAART